MHLHTNTIYHLYNRGNNLRQLYFDEADYWWFHHRISTLLTPHCDILSWSLLPNKFHLMIAADDRTIIERRFFGGGRPMQEFPYCIGLLLSTYSQYQNRKRKTTGSYFQQKTKVFSIQEEMSGKDFQGNSADYILDLLHYHHMLPVRSGLVAQADHWPYSSCLDYSGLREDSLSNKELLFALTQNASLNGARTFRNSLIEMSATGNSTGYVI